MEGNKHVTTGTHHPACYNKPRVKQETVRNQDGWHDDGRARFIVRPATKWNFDGCSYARTGYAAKDPGCTGCIHS